MNEKEAIIKVKDSNDKSAFAVLYNRYWTKVYNFALLYVTSTFDAEEIVQEVFVRLWEGRASLDAEQNFEGYLFIIIRNLIFNHSRRTFNEDYYKMTVLEAVEVAYDMEGELDAANLKSYIESLVSLMSPRQQEVFRLSRDEQLSYREIALRLQITEKTVERHISDALKILKKNLFLLILFVHQ